ncbi:MAG: hypothetical protein K2L54_00585, partial [Clostridiales bacterium]|nr:hypothetical protein [Clostridiales bacterium]
DGSLTNLSTLRAEGVNLTEQFAYVSAIINTLAAKTEPEYVVSLKMHKAMYELAQNDYIPRLEEFLKNSFVVPVRLDVNTVEFAQSGNMYATANSVGRTEYSISDVKPILGNLAPATAQSISSITANAYNVTVCGVFAMPTEFMSKGGRKYERFLLYDGETSLQCRFSPSGTSLADPALLGKTVCVLGNAEYDAYRNEASVSVRELSLCKADGLVPVSPVPAPSEYERVKPQPYNEYVQSSMFDGGFVLPPALKGRFVVFDFETTGLSVLHDRPTELGAVKVIDGKITDGFSTLIDPRRPIPEEVAIKTGITDDMVKGQPLFEDVLPDFYKFSYGCSFVCHNIAFDFPFLLKGGNRCGLAFGDRRTFDTMAIAPMALPGIQKLSLDKVLEGLGLVNDNAHRAMTDAAATAKAFVAMHRILADKSMR